MKLDDVKSIPWRIKVLITRKTTWLNDDGSVSHTVKETPSAAWAIAGIHSWKWWWVRKYGQLDCGCVRNPLTRKFVLYSYRPECYKGHTNL